MPKEANEVHQHPITTPHACEPPSGKVGMAGAAGLASSCCSSLSTLLTGWETALLGILSDMTAAGQA